MIYLIILLVIHRCPRMNHKNELLNTTHIMVGVVREIRLSLLRFLWPHLEAISIHKNIVVSLVKCSCLVPCSLRSSFTLLLIHNLLSACTLTPQWAIARQRSLYVYCTASQLFFRHIAYSSLVALHQQKLKKVFFSINIKTKRSLNPI